MATSARVLRKKPRGVALDLDAQLAGQPQHRAQVLAGLVGRQVGGADDLRPSVSSTIRAMPCPMGPRPHVDDLERAWQGLRPSALDLDGGDLLLGLRGQDHGGLAMGSRVV